MLKLTKEHNEAVYAFMVLFAMANHIQCMADELLDDLPEEMAETKKAFEVLELTFEKEMDAVHKKYVEQE